MKIDLSGKLAIVSGSTAGIGLGISKALAECGATVVVIGRDTAKVEQIKRIAAAHGVSIKAAALQFSLANPAVAAAIPGASRPERIAEDISALAEVVPAAFWQDLRDARLVSERAPLPIIGA